MFSVKIYLSLGDTPIGSREIWIGSDFLLHGLLARSFAQDIVLGFVEVTRVDWRQSLKFDLGVKLGSEHQDKITMDTP